MLPFSVVVALVILAALFKAVMDTLQFHYQKSVFSTFSKWWNPAESWVLKWKEGNPEKGERFLGSSTVLAWTTDAWHFFQMLFLSCFQLAIAILIAKDWLSFLIWFFALKAGFSLVFEVAFSKIFTRR